MIELKALYGQVRALVDDLRAQVVAGGDLRATLSKEHAEAKAAKRTGVTFEAWCDDALDQAAVAWVLGCVFVRFCEDNRLVEPLWIGGPEPDASADRAMQARQAYIMAAPLKNDRHWLREAFTYLAGLRATGRLFDDHNPVWRFHISGEAAEALSDFFRRGEGARSLRSSTWDTRFLGDLYQDLSAHARSTYALLQTPVFVEEFILDRTFEPAVREFGLAPTAVIDPTCGSGHFLLGAFERLVNMWTVRQPATDIRILVERALGQVTGVDINPFVVGIARFRLMIAALRACRLSSLERAPNFELRVATGDSLLPWGDAKVVAELSLDIEGAMRPSPQPHAVDQAIVGGEKIFAYATEDEDVLPRYLRPDQYTVVVGNPPYITVKDPVLNDRYRAVYKTCSGQYAMSVPFAERFFGLAKRADHDGDGAGWVGQIIANSFMKREFGKKLINEFLAQRVELVEVIDASGAYIPGHGTPTVILVGRNRLVSPRYSGPIRAVLGVRGEPSQPEDPSKGLVWTAILEKIDRPGSDSDWVSVADLARAQLANHPWSLSGGGAVELMVAIDLPCLLSSVAESVGRTTVVGDDDAWILPDLATARRLGEESYVEPFVIGECVRDYALAAVPWARRPYTNQFHTEAVTPDHDLVRHLWTVRTVLSSRIIFGRTLSQQGRPWYEHLENYVSKLRVPMSIAFAEVATHNHFVLDRGGKVFKQTAPVIKLRSGASDEDHLRLLGVLNSSTICFWLKQVCFPKGGSGIGRGIQPEDWMGRFAFNASNVEQIPLPETFPLELSREADALAQRLSEASPASVAVAGVPRAELLATAREEWHAVRARMITLQEELDWQVYRLYGLLDEDLAAADAPELALGERAFEIVLARRLAAGEVETQWFARHGSTPITELPRHWSQEYRSTVERRIAVIESDRNIALIERPECKRRWATEGWDAMRTAALRDWLLDRLEAPELWAGNPTLLSVAQLADRVRHDDDFRSVLDLWVGTDQHDLVKTIGALVADEHVPFLPAERYKASGLRKRAEWERMWALQRREDAGETVDIAVPTKYTSADFAKPSYWRNRGKLDVPKERFISYPRAGRDSDGTELLGWAGWDHLAQARALAAVYLDRNTQAGWQAARLLPLLAGLVELEAWLHQWYADPQPGFVGSPAEFFTGLIDTELSGLGADRSALAKVRGVEG
jgi:hypothetical protein